MIKYVIAAMICMSGLSASAQYAPENDVALEAARAGEWQEAWDIWKPLADAGDARAQSNIGVMYDQGMLVEEDDAEAVRWFALSAEGGFPTGQFNLGNMYAEGKGVAQNFSVAVRWFQTAARQGHPQAQMALMRAYYRGEGVTQDYGFAYMWMEIAAEAGHEGALNNIADFGSRIGKEAIARGREMAAKCRPIGLENCP